MTKKDYVAIARVINNARTKGSIDFNKSQAMLTCSVIAWGIAELMAEDNPRFNRDKFLTACEV